MESVFIEHTENGKRVYKSLLVEPEELSVLNSPMAVDIIKELKRQPCCALDIARNLQEDGQKVYYYLRKLEKSGMVTLTRTERRHGMTAKIYKVTAPVVTAKLYEDGHVIEDSNPIRNLNILKFFNPFIEDGNLNARIVIGDPNEHGRFDAQSKEGSYFTDIAIFLGGFIKKNDFPFYIIDTELDDNDLNENLILIGNARTNTVIDRLRDYIPITFLDKDHHSFISKKTNKIFKDPRTGFVIKIKNPFNKKKNIMIIGGVRTRGMRAAAISLTQNIDELVKTNEYKDSNSSFIRVVKGLDKKGKGLIDSVEFLE